MCKARITETRFNRKHNAQPKTALMEFIGAIRMTLVTSTHDVEVDLAQYESVLFGLYSIFMQTIQYEPSIALPLSAYGETISPEFEEIEKAYIDFDDGRTILVSLARVQYDENLKPRYLWEVFEN